MKNELLEKIEKTSARSAWAKGVKKYAYELIEDMDNDLIKEMSQSPLLIEKTLLNGACNWNEYSWGGCSLIYNEDIAKRLCNNSELKKTKNGQNKPNKNEEWLDTQTRALRQACNLIKSIIKAG